MLSHNQKSNVYFPSETGTTTDRLSGKEAVKHLGVKLSLPSLRTSCVSPPVFQVRFSSVFAGLSVSQCFGPQLCDSGVLVQTRVGSRFTSYVVGKLSCPNTVVLASDNLRLSRGKMYQMDLKATKNCPTKLTRVPIRQKCWQAPQEQA